MVHGKENTEMKERNVYDVGSYMRVAHPDARPGRTGAGHRVIRVTNVPDEMSDSELITLLSYMPIHGYRLKLAGGDA